MSNKFTYLIKTDDDDNRHVYRIEHDLGTHYTVTNPLFVCFGSVFSNWGRRRTVSKKYLTSRKFVRMSSALEKKYNAIKRDDSTGDLFD